MHHVKIDGSFAEFFALVMRGLNKRIWGHETGEVIFSTVDHANSTYVRSTTWFGRDLDLSGVSVTNGANTPTMKATLISPRHVVLANHYHPGNTTIRFVSKNNAVVTRTITNSMTVDATDLRIGVLDSDVPSTIKFFKVCTAQDNLDKAGSIAFFIEQNWRAYVGYTTSLPAYGGINKYPPAPRNVFWKNGGPIAGDSSHPVFSVIRDEPIFLFALHFASSFGGYGPEISRRIDLVNSAMTALGGGRQLTFWS